MATSFDILRRVPRPFPVLALELLANCGPKGCSQASLMAHGFTFKLMLALVRIGFATMRAEQVPAGRRTMDVITVCITDAGRRALATL